LRERQASCNCSCSRVDEVKPIEVLGFIQHESRSEIFGWQLSKTKRPVLTDPSVPGSGVIVCCYNKRKVFITIV
jgi:hypothetical protein